MRGEHAGGGGKTLRQRITPAYAGRTGCGGEQPAGEGDHPRVCGENPRVPTPFPPKTGSPPRMRGEPRRRELHLKPEAITPAYAGRTPESVTRTGYAGDHPRVCGENDQASAAGITGLGSPPRMRGELNGAPAVDFYDRITPAYAGRTTALEGKTGNYEDHPRVCGENRSDRLSVLPRVGSPPRMRGEPSMPPALSDRHRITPAYAGRTDGRSLRDCHGADHPRVCGENSLIAPIKFDIPGSPPRMRGEQQTIRGIFEKGGITPAYAGRTFGLGECGLP